MDLNAIESKFGFIGVAQNYTMKTLILSTAIALIGTPVMAEVDPLLLAYFIEEHSPVYTDLDPEKAGKPILEATYIEMPKVAVMDREELKTLAKREQYVDGLYIFGHQTIYISDSVNLSTTYGESVVLHELVHHTQYMTGLGKTAPCSAALEADAYEIQADYLVANGFAKDSVEVSELMKLSALMTMCKPGYLIERSLE